MRTLKERLLSDNEIKESLLSEIDTTLARGAYDVIINNIFSTNIQQRREAFDKLCSMVESYRPKQHKTTAKMKNSDSYFVEFSYPLNIKNGEVTEILDWINCIQICKRIEAHDYRMTFINASNEQSGHSIIDYDEIWPYIRSEFNPKSENTKLYEVPEKLNDLFEKIQMEAYNHR